MYTFEEKELIDKLFKLNLFYLICTISALIIDRFPASITDPVFASISISCLSTLAVLLYPELGIDIPANRYTQTG